MNPDRTLPLVPGLAVAREIARGGMATVYAARDPVFERDVAVKVMHPGCDSTQFVVEAKVTAQLPHPGVPPVYALGVLPDRRPFLVMKLIQGQTLAAAIADLHSDRTARFDTLGVFELICQTVGFAHAKGVVHRDLKPSNVMVGKFGEVQVMDWGIAKHVAGPGAAAGTAQLKAPAGVLETVAGSVKGTPAYMAPEQARGEPIDARTDVFALGGILAALLTGRPPFSGATAMDTLFHAAAADLAECHDRLADCGADDDLTAIARRCLEPHPGARYADGTKVAEAVADYRFGVEERLRTAERERAARAAQAREGRKRRRVQAALVGAILLLAVGGGAFAWWNERQSGRLKAAAQEQQLKDERAAAEVRERQQRNAAVVALLLDQCEGHVRNEETDRAATVLGEIDRRVREGVESPPRARIDRCRADLTILRELERVDGLLWADERGEEAAVEQWRAALSKAGLNPDTTSPDRVQRLVRDSLARERALGALDHWLAWQRPAGVADVLRAADPDPYRNAVRAAYQNRERDQLARLAGQSAALDQPIRFAAVMGNMPSIPFERREEILLTASRARPDSLVVIQRLYVLYRQAKETAEERIRWSQAALALRPNSRAFWTNLGVALSDRGDTAGAVGTYRAALRLFPDDAVLYTNMGAAMKAGDDPDGAIVAFRRAIELDREHAAAHHNLALALRDKGQLAEAIAAHERAARLKPEWASYRVSLGYALAQAGDHPAAIRAFRAAIEIEPKFALAHAGLGTSLRATDDLPGAIAAFETAVKLAPKSEKFQALLKGAKEGKP